ncbi:MAG: TolC family protein [Ferruginibacter sp.]
MMKSKVLVAVLGLIAGIYNNAIAQTTTSAYNLKACIDAAQTNNIPVKQNELLTEQASINYNTAKYSRLPNVSAGVGYGINNGRSIDPFTNGYINQQLSSSNASLNASVPIFKGFQTQRNIEQTSLVYQATKQEYQQEKDNLALNVILAFLQVLNNEDVLDLTKKQAAVTQKQVERLDELNKAGATAPATLSDMQGQYASDQIGIVNAANALELSKLALAQLMNIPYTKDMQLSREGIDMSVEMYAATSDQIYAAATGKLAMVKAADLRVKAAAKSTQLAKGGLYPTLSLEGQLSTNYSSATRSSFVTGSADVPTTDYVVVSGNNLPVITKQTNYNSSKIGYFSQAKNNLGNYLGLNLQVPIFNGLQARSRIALAKVQEKNTGFIAENTRIALQQAIEQAYLNMSTSFNKYKLLDEQVKAFDESFRAAEIRFNLGALNSVDYLVVKNNLDRANVNFTIARYEYLLRTKVLDFYQGNLK